MAVRSRLLLFWYDFFAGGFVFLFLFYITLVLSNHVISDSQTGGGVGHVHTDDTVHVRARSRTPAGGSYDTMGCNDGISSAGVPLDFWIDSTLLLRKHWACQGMLGSFRFFIHTRPGVCPPVLLEKVTTRLGTEGRMHNGCCHDA